LESHPVLGQDRHVDLDVAARILLARQPDMLNIPHRNAVQTHGGAFRHGRGIFHERAQMDAPLEEFGIRSQQQNQRAGDQQRGQRQ